MISVLLNLRGYNATPYPDHAANALLALLPPRNVDEVPVLTAVLAVAAVTEFRVAMPKTCPVKSPCKNTTNAPLAGNT
ncbi:hypothetical protein, partial [Klebsiella pneumoniae]|uniref:hypothetical protein n=1 Tax=Klebsiella pneumoniae TaxID=573 RepID=UPI001D1117C7